MTAIGKDDVIINRSIPGYCAIAFKEEYLNVFLQAIELRDALIKMVEAYREGCADDDEPSMVREALAVLREAEVPAP